MLAEFLVIAGPDGPKYLDTLNSSACFEIAEFDQRAAVELAAPQVRGVDKRSGLTETPYQKVKIDRQIVVIAKVKGADRIYSDDGDVVRLAAIQGMEALGVADLPLPPPRSGELPFVG